MIILYFFYLMIAAGTFIAIQVNDNKFAGKEISSIFFTVFWPIYWSACIAVILERMCDDP